MKNISLIMLVVGFFSCKSIHWDVNKVDCYTNKKNDLVGLVDREALLSNTKMDECFVEYFSEYHPDELIINQIKENLSGVKVITFFGTWCSDSQEQLPLFFKILDKAGYDQSNHRIVALNKKKKAGGLQRNQNIQRVPTFIVLRGNKEIGRVIEKPKPNSNLEKDFLEILIRK